MFPLAMRLGACRALLRERLRLRGARRFCGALRSARGGLRRTRLFPSLFRLRRARRFLFFFVVPEKRWSSAGSVLREDRIGRDDELIQDVVVGAPVKREHHGLAAHAEPSAGEVEEKVTERAREPFLDRAIAFTLDEKGFTLDEKGLGEVDVFRELDTGIGHALSVDDRQRANGEARSRRLELRDDGLV